MKITNLKVSSTLNNQKKLYGKQNMIDGNDDTCWNAEGVGASYDGNKEADDEHKEHVLLKTGSKFVLVRRGDCTHDESNVELRIQFQGGFTPHRIEVFIADPSNTTGKDAKKCTLHYCTLYNIDDTNRMQRFVLSKVLSEKVEEKKAETQPDVDMVKLLNSPIDKLKIVFVGSSDFYGRITIYHLQVVCEE